MFWDDETLDEFVDLMYPQHSALYWSYPLRIHQIDMARCLLLDYFGGLYADMDFECLQPLDPLLAEKTALFTQEPVQHAHIVYHQQSIVSNALMYTQPQHPIWAQVIKEMYRRAHDPRYRKKGVLHLTGPAVIDFCVRRASCFVTPPDWFFPLVAPGHEQHAVAWEQVYGIHHWANTWCK